MNFVYIVKKKKKKKEKIEYNLIWQTHFCKLQIDYHSVNLSTF